MQREQWTEKNESFGSRPSPICSSISMITWGKDGLLSIAKHAREGGAASEAFREIHEHKFLHLDDITSQRVDQSHIAPLQTLCNAIVG